MYESIVFCSACTMSSVSKFMFAISSPDEFLVSYFTKQHYSEMDYMSKYVTLVILCSVLEYA